MSTIALPVLRTAMYGKQATVAYEALTPPLGFIKLVTGQLSKTEAESYLGWLKEVEHERPKPLLNVLREEGFKAETCQQIELAELAAFLRRWYPFVMATWGPGPQGCNLALPPTARVPRPISGPGAIVEDSLAHDVSFIIACHARLVDPKLDWTITAERAGGWTKRTVTLGGEHLVYHSTHFLDWCRIIANADTYQHYYPYAVTDEGLMSSRLQALARTIGEGKSRPAEQEPDIEPLVIESRFSQRSAPPPDRPQPPPALTEAVATYREVGLFADASDLSIEQLAQVLKQTWEDIEHTEMPLTAPQLDESLLALDYQRTIEFPVEADVAPGNKVYESIIRALADISGDRVKVRAVSEDWSKEEEVIVRVLVNRRAAEFRLRRLGDYVDPQVVAKVNSLIPTDEQRFWHYHDGPELARIVRASRTEAAELEAARGVRLREEPPEWWDVMAEED